MSFAIKVLINMEILELRLEFLHLLPHKSKMNIRENNIE